MQSTSIHTEVFADRRFRPYVGEGGVGRGADEYGDPPRGRAIRAALCCRIKRGSMIRIASHELLIINIEGDFDFQALKNLAKELNEIERYKVYPKRFSEVSKLRGITVGFNEIFQYQQLRIKPKKPVQTAFCGFSVFMYGMARMFQSILASDYHRIEIFKDIESAAAWLQVDVNLIKRETD